MNTPPLEGALQPWQPILGIAIWAALAHLLYWGRDRWPWAGRTVAWMTRTSGDPRALFALALLADAVVIVLLIIWLSGR